MEHLSEAYRPVPGVTPAESGLTSALAGAPVDEETLFQIGLENYLAYFEKGILEQCLKRFTGTLEEMATRLQVSRPTLYRRLKKHQIGSSRFDEAH